MSYILDALKRADAERERERGQVPGLHAQTNHAITPAEQTGVPWKRLALPMVLSLLVLGSIGWWLARSASTAIPAVMPANQAQNMAPLAPVAMPDAAVPHPAMSPIGGMPGLPAATNPKVKDRTGTPPTAQASIRPPANSTPKSVTPNAAAPVQASPLPPALAALPDGVRASIPKLVLSGSVYSINPGQRMLIINGQVFHEGSSPAADVTLERIGPQAAVLNFRGTQFTLPY